MYVYKKKKKNKIEKISPYTPYVICKQKQQKYAELFPTHRYD